jgi:uracil-DNA glycosylase
MIFQVNRQQLLNGNKISMKQSEYLAAMGIQVWTPRTPEETAKANTKTQEIIVQQDSWDELQQKVAGCALCELHKTRKNTVFGVGNKQSKLLIVGEAPGATEDEQGKPFVGRAGKLLDSMLASIDLKREDIFIANILKCRPPNNRDPLPAEVQLCTPYLNQQIALLQPKIIVALGRIAAHFLLNTDSSLGSMRGKIYQYGEQQVPLIVTFHPAYLLRFSREKAKAYDDLLKIQQILKYDI